MCGFRIFFARIQPCKRYVLIVAMYLINNNMM